MFISEGNVSNIENGNTMCILEHIIHICEIFNVYEEYLYFRDAHSMELSHSPSSKLESLLEGVR